MNVLAAAPLLTIHRSRKLIPEFDLYRPKTAIEAVAIKAALGTGAVFMAGGVDVVNRMKFGVPVVAVIHLGGIPGLDGIIEDAGGLRLGALTTHDQMATSRVVARHHPALAETWGDVANIRVRCKGTLGGNIMSGDPAYDFALTAIAANARLEFVESNGIRVVAAAGPDPTTSDGLLAAIIMPPAATLRLSFDRSLRPVVSLALGLDFVGKRIVGGRVAIGCAFAQAIAVRLPVKDSLPPSEMARRADTLACEVAAALPEPIGDLVAGSSYRRRMIEVLLRRHLGAVS